MRQLFAALHGPAHAVLRGAQLHRIGGKRLGNGYRRLIRFARTIVGSNRERAAMGLRHVLRDVFGFRLVIIILVVLIVRVVLKLIAFIIEVVLIPEV